MFQKLMDDIKDAGLCVHGIELRRFGDVADRFFFHEDKAYPVYSATKSVTSAAVMSAIADGKLSMDDKLYTYLDSKYLPLMSDAFKSLSFHDFMTMTAAPYPFRPEGGDWIKNILELDVDYSDRGYHYSNIPAYLVGAACENALGRPLIEYLTERIFKPMDIPTPEYRTSPEGHFYGATGLTLTLENFGKLGELFLQNGCYGSKQLIPEELVKEAVTEKVKTDDGGYGYFFPTNDIGFSLRGKWGQRSMICPRKQTVVTCLCDLPHNTGGIYERQLYAMIDDFIKSI